MFANAMLLVLTLVLAASVDNKLVSRTKRQDGDDIHIYVCGGGGGSGFGYGGGYGGYGYMCNPYMMYMMNPWMMYGGYGYGTGIYGGYGTGVYGGAVTGGTGVGTVMRECIGPCVNAQCPAGYTCTGGQCCR